MVRFHLLFLLLPLISHSKQLPKIVTVDIGQTQNIFKHYILFFTIGSRCLTQTPKAMSPAERKAAFWLSVVQANRREIFYSMAATIVRLEDRQLQAIMEGS